VRTDRIGSLPADFVRPETCTQADWDRFLGRVKWDASDDHLWVEYTVST
jgi:hypothetical protein